MLSQLAVLLACLPDVQIYRAKQPRQIVPGLDVQEPLVGLGLWQPSVIRGEVNYHRQLGQRHVRRKVVRQRID